MLWGSENLEILGANVIYNPQELEMFQRASKILPVISKNYTLQESETTQISTEKETIQAEDYIQMIKKINRLPIYGVDVYYADDYWNFDAKRNTNVNSSYFHYNFEKCPIEYRETVKNYVFLSIIWNREQLQSIYAKYNIVCKFFSWLSSKNINKLQEITPEHVREWIETFSKCKITTRQGYLSLIKRFFVYYNANFYEIFNEKHFETVNSINPQLLSAVKEQSKTPNLPESFFNKMLSTAIKVMNDEDEKKFYRGMSAMLVILSQTGLRTGELFALEIDGLKTITLRSGEAAHYLEYKTWKRERGSKRSSTERTYVNALTKQAYDILIELYNKRRIEWGMQYLFLDSIRKPNKDQMPVTPQKTTLFFKELFYFYDKYMPTILDEPSQDPKLPTIEYYPKSKLCNRKQKYIIKPTPMQLRVHMCTALYQKGIPEEYVERFMSHLSSEMTAYYYRPKNSPQKDMQLAQKTLKEIITGKATPLGANKGLVDKINQYIIENNYNIKTDLNEIAETLSKELPIRIKTGGVCIKSSKFRECSKDAITNEFFCAYGVCPNLYTFYYMIDITVEQLKELQQNISINTKKGHVRQVEKEKNMVRSIVNNKLNPQLKDLKKKVEEFGMEEILKEHPQLSEIIPKLELIEKEMEAIEWN